MKEKILKILKWFFIILGIIFFIQIILALFIFICLSLPFKTYFKIDNNAANSEKTFKIIQPIINYAENYYKENNKYPDKIDENIKFKKTYTYKYEVSKNNNCYTITIEPNENQKFLSGKNNKTIKQYQHCQANSENSTSSSESYLEFSK